MTPWCNNTLYPSALPHIVYSACPDCGHTMLLHPGFHNTSTKHCLVCELVEVINVRRTPQNDGINLPSIGLYGTPPAIERGPLEDAG